MRVLPLFVVACVVLVAAHDARSVQLTYLSQSGDLDAAGRHPALTDSTLNLPIGGLSDVDEVLIASDAAGSDAYEGRAELTTVLGANSLFINGASAASVQGCDPFSDPACFASGAASVSILFDLDQSAMGQILSVQHPFTNNGANLVLTHQSLGFSLGVTYFGDFEIPDCGALDFDSCMALAGVFGSGAVLPGGQYQLAFDVFAFTPTGSCSAGCNDAGGSYQLNIIPEPATGILLGIGLLGLAWARPVSPTRKRGA